ncbi:MAG: 4a-hydroxytetrahydrobiopterin dehydratase [Polyangiaceae bacterium]|nr:4a-hydroxytetrahydrobiopterin dehydratase [Polyangiaceae bacterium]
MARPRLEPQRLQAWLDAHPGWHVEQSTLTRCYSFPDYPTTIAFVTRLAFAAEKYDHHPDLLVTWGKVEVRWITHDAGGLTDLDLTLAEVTERLATG